MSTPVLQHFLDRARSTDRPLQSSIYIELGALLVEFCRAAPEKPLSEDARRSVAGLLRAALASTHPGLTSFRQFSGLFRAICARKLIAADQFEQSALAFLNATVGCFPAYERSSFIESVNDCLKEREGGPRRRLLAGLLDRTCYDRDLGDLSYDAQLAAASFLKPAIDFELREASSSNADGQSLRVAEAPAPTDLPPGLVETRGELGQLAGTLSWLSLSFDDRLKAHCGLLVQLLELLSEGVKEIGASQIDSLNRRENIFAEEAIQPAPFYDGDF